jgi:hypothetical protein
VYGRNQKAAGDTVNKVAIIYTGALVFGFAIGYIVGRWEKETKACANP